MKLYRIGSDRIGSDRIGSDRIGSDRIGSDRIGSDRIGSDRIGSDAMGRSCGKDDSRKIGKDKRQTQTSKTQRKRKVAGGESVRDMHR